MQLKNNSVFIKIVCIVFTIYTPKNHLGPKSGTPHHFSKAVDSTTKDRHAPAVTRSFVTWQPSNLYLGFCQCSFESCRPSKKKGQRFPQPLGVVVFWVVIFWPNKSMFVLKTNEDSGMNEFPNGSTWLASGSHMHARRFNMVASVIRSSKKKIILQHRNIKKHDGEAITAQAHRGWGSGGCFFYIGWFAFPWLIVYFWN